MRKGLITAALLTVGLVFSAAGCSSKSASKCTVSIDNKEAMQADWLSDDPSRTLSLTITKDGEEQNVTEAVNDGDLVITSSDTAVATVIGRVVNPVGPGTATITATYGGASDSVVVTVTYSDPHGKSASDPLTVAEAIAVCEATGTTQTNIKYYIKGYVTKIGSEYDETYGNMTFYIADQKDDTTNTIDCYRAKPADDVDPSIIWIDSEVLVAGYLINYNGNTPELNQGGEILSATQGYVPQTIDVTVAEALTACQALAENASSKDFYQITGYVVAMSGSNFYMSDTKGEITPTKDDFLVYGNSNSDVAVDNKVTVKATLKYYKSTTSDSYAYETNTPKSVIIHQEGVALNVVSKTLVIEGTYQLVASATPTGAELADVSWASSAESVATVSDAGLVTAVAEGTATITATSGEFTATASIKVVETAIDATAVTLDNETLALVYPGAGATLTATVTPADTTDEAVWSTDNSAVATVEDGVVTVTGVGTANITVTYNESVSATCAVTVTALHGTVESDPLTIDEAYTIATKVSGNNANDGNKYYIKGLITGINSAYSADYKNISLNTLTTANQTFVLYRLSCTAEKAADLEKGVEILVQAYITKYNSTYETAQGGIIVSYDNSKVTMMEISGSSIVAVGNSNTITLSTTTYPTAASAEGTFAWSSSDDTLATVSSAGVVTGVAEGEVTITCTYSENDEVLATATFAVEVFATISYADLPSGGVTLDYSTLGLADYTSYASNNNRSVTVGDFTVKLDRKSVGCIMAASGAYSSGGALGISCMQLKKGGLDVARFNTFINSASTVTIIMYATYSTEGPLYCPAVQFGDTVVAQTSTQSGVDTGKTSGSYSIYKYTLTYDVSALSKSSLSILSATSGAAYIESIVVK